jgi:hypothetical protein
MIFVVQEIVKRGVVELYASLAVRGSPLYAREILWGMSNVAAGTLPQATQVLDAGFIDIGIDYLRNAQSSVIARESGWLLSNLLVSNLPDIIPKMVEKGIVELFLTTLISFGTQDLVREHIDLFTHFICCACGNLWSYWLTHFS